MSEGTTTQYQEKLYDVESIPAPDDLLAAGSAFTGKIKVSAAGSYKRGEIMMRSGDGFVRGTQSGIASASEVCILCKDMELEDGETAEVSGYFMGHYNKRRVMLEGEMLTEYEAAETESVIETLRKHKIFLR